jgi:hypothetical protein
MVTPLDTAICGKKKFTLSSMARLRQFMTGAGADASCSPVGRGSGPWMPRTRSVAEVFDGERQRRCELLYTLAEDLDGVVALGELRASHWQPP